MRVGAGGSEEIGHKREVEKKSMVESTWPYRKNDLARPLIKLCDIGQIDTFSELCQYSYT